MNIGTKSALGTVAMLASVLSLAAVARFSLGSVGAQLERATGPVATQLALAGNLKAAANGMRTGQRGMLLKALEHDTAGMNSVAAEYDGRVRELQSLLGNLKPMLLDGRGRDLASLLNAKAEQHAASFREVRDLCAAGRVTEAEAVYKQRGASAGAAMEKTAAELMKFETELMAQSAEAGNRAASRADAISTAMVVLGLIVAAGVYNMQRHTISELRRIACQMEQGSAEIAGATGQLSAASQSL